MASTAMDASIGTVASTAIDASIGVVEGLPALAVLPAAGPVPAFAAGLPADPVPAWEPPSGRAPATFASAPALGPGIVAGSLSAQLPIAVIDASATPWAIAWLSFPSIPASLPP